MASPRHDLEGAWTLVGRGRDHGAWGQLDLEQFPVAALVHYRHGHGKAECLRMDSAVCPTLVPSTTRAPAP
jgi:hypothetical protein